MQELHGAYPGLLVMAFPCNQFGSQESKPENVIKEFVKKNYNAEFPLMSKIQVNGAGAHPLYKHMKTDAGVADIKWNFDVFLLDRNFEVEGYYRQVPNQLIDKIEALLKQ